MCVSHAYSVWHEPISCSTVKNLKPLIRQFLAFLFLASTWFLIKNGLFTLFYCIYVVHLICYFIIINDIINIYLYPS